MGLIESLQKVGFTRHESILYLLLCKDGELTGYEAAKRSGIPRSNAYLALAGLVDKGGACRLESDTAKFIAVPPREMAENLRNQLHESLDLIIIAAPQREWPLEPFVTVSGKTQVHSKIKHVLREAMERIYLALGSAELETFLPELKKALGQGRKVVLITDPPFQLKGAIIHHRPKPPGEIRLIVDSSAVLTGSIAANCVFSKNPNLVQLIKDSLTNEIELIELKQKTETE
jgi:sugar-specific transcriptional regulator TrmB